MDTTAVGDETVSHNLPRALFPHTGRGKELCEMLREELSIPDGAQEFEVRFALHEAVSVRCTYLPKPKG